MLGIKKLDWLIVKSYLLPFVITFFVTTFILLLQFLWKYIDDLVGKGLDFSIIIELFFFASMGLLELSFPLAVLCASVYVYGNLGQNNELIAIKASGISLMRIMRPLIITNVFLACFAFVYANNILPYSNLRLWSLMFDVRQQRPEINIQEGIFYDGIEQIRIKIRSKNQQTNMMYGVMIYDHRKDDGNSNVTTADSAFMQVTPNEQYVILTLYDGVRYEEITDKYSPRETRQKRPFRIQEFSEQQVLFTLDPSDFSRTNMELFRHNVRMQNLPQLLETLDSTKNLKRHLNNRSFEHFFRYNVFKSLPTDSLYTAQVSTDSLFLRLPIQRKKQAIEKALSLARSADSYLRSNIENYHQQNLSLNRNRIEIHKKITLAFSCFIMFFVGAPFGAIVRKGGLGVPIIFSFIFFLKYYIISMIGEKGVKSAEMDAVFGMWLASGVVLIIGVYFTYLATHDKVITRPGLLLKELFLKIPFIKKNT